MVTMSDHPSLRHHQCRYDIKSLLMPLMARSYASMAAAQQSNSDPSNNVPSVVHIGQWPFRFSNLQGHTFDSSKILRNFLIAQWSGRSWGGVIITSDSIARIRLTGRLLDSEMLAGDVANEVKHYYRRYYQPTSPTTTTFLQFCYIL